jgi:hypothetical protein
MGVAEGFEESGVVGLRSVRTTSPWSARERGHRGIIVERVAGVRANLG